MRDPLDVALVAAAAMGACFGFLWWNASPARIFMGDTGSLALGGLLAGLAIVTRTELLLVVLGGLFVVETLSVIIQVGSSSSPGSGCSGWRRCTTTSSSPAGPRTPSSCGSGWSPASRVAFGLGLFYADSWSDARSVTLDRALDGDACRRRAASGVSGAAAAPGAAAPRRAGHRAGPTPRGPTRAADPRRRASALARRDRRRPGELDLVVTSPGWRPDAPLLGAAAGARGSR